MRLLYVCLGSLAVTMSSIVFSGGVSEDWVKKFEGIWRVSRVDNNKRGDFLIDAEATNLGNMHDIVIAEVQKGKRVYANEHIVSRQIESIQKQIHYSRILCVKKACEILLVTKDMKKNYVERMSFLIDSAVLKASSATNGTMSLGSGVEGKRSLVLYKVAYIVYS